jgi:hypothetical protein
MSNDITSANATYLLTITGVFSAAQQLQEFAADRAFETAELDVAETLMGVDGVLSGGWVPNPVIQTITLQANSASMVIFETWMEANRLARGVFTATGQITLPSINRSYTMVNGILQRVAPIATAMKILQPRSFAIAWQEVIPVPV